MGEEEKQRAGLFVTAELAWTVLILILGGIIGAVYSHVTNSGHPGMQEAILTNQKVIQQIVDKQDNISERVRRLEIKQGEDR